MKQYRNILVNSLVNLGDVLLTTSAIALLRKQYPKARITMLVRPVVREAVENNPVIDDVILFAYQARKNSFRKMWDMVQELRQRHFDLAISFDRKLRPALLCWLAGIPERVCPERVFDDIPSRVTWFYTKVIPIQHDLDTTLQAETYQAIIRGFTGCTGQEAPVMARILPAHEKKAAALLAEAPSNARRIVFCVKGTFPLKTWPKEYFARLADSLAQQPTAFFIVGAPGDWEYAEEVIAGMHQPVVNLCGATSLMELAALFHQIDLLVTVDTGATHIAATTGVPMVVMYGCTSPQRWHPINENARVLTSSEPCCPCHYRAEECPSHPRPACLWKVTPEMVWEKCQELLAGRQL